MKASAIIKTPDSILIKREGEKLKGTGKYWWWSSEKQAIITEKKMEKEVSI